LQIEQDVVGLLSGHIRARQGVSTMRYVYKLEVEPDHKKLGLTRMIGKDVAYFDNFPTVKRALAILHKHRYRHPSKLDVSLMRDLGGEKEVREQQREQKLFNETVDKIVVECGIPSKKSFLSPKWTKTELKELSKEERSIAMVSNGCDYGRIRLSRIRVWSAS
jgi:hypothetical protein